MNETMFIPSKLKIGFQSRNDTFTGKLAYIIYYDEKGKLRKEKSWESWRSKNISAIEIDNTPISGHTLNKGVQRDGYWGSGRSVVRVWDPRDFEFEVSIDNLIGLLMHSDVSKRDIQQECVFAWKGTELILLPTNSAEYASSILYTDKQSLKFSTKDLVPGYTYTPKKEPNPYIYLGHFESFKALDNDDGTIKQDLINGKQHWFAACHNGKPVRKLSPSSFFATVDMAEVHPKYPGIIERLFKTPLVQPIVGFKTEAMTSDSMLEMRGFYIEIKEGHFLKFEDRLTTKDYNPLSNREFRVKFNAVGHTSVQADGTVKSTREFNNRNLYYYRPAVVPEHVKEIEEKINAAVSGTYMLSGSYLTKNYIKGGDLQKLVDDILSVVDAKSIHFVLKNGHTTEGLNYGD